MRVTRTILVALSVVLGGALAANARILGGGPKAPDCFLYFNGIDATSKSNIVEEKTLSDRCTFTFSLCTGATDVQGCSPADVTSFGGIKHGLNAPLTGPANCASPSSVEVKLKKKRRPVKLVLKPSAKTATGKPKTDRDTLILKCSSSPSGAFIFE